MRHRDLHIMSVGRAVYTKDGRFSVYHQRHTGEWTLQLRSAQLKDSGLYECQIGTQPTRSYFVNLQVVGKCTEHRDAPSAPFIAPSKLYETLLWSAGGFCSDAKTQKAALLFLPFFLLLFAA